jgi:hypothetical protein
MPGAPSGYDTLRTYLPERAQRRRALGVTENTIIAWDERRARRVRREHQRKVSVLLDTCERIRPFFSEPAGIATFLVTPQLILDNREPYCLIRLHGERGAEIVSEIVKDEAQRAARLREKFALETVLADDAAWSAIRDGLSDAALARVKSSAPEASGIRRRRGTRDLLT